MGVEELGQGPKTRGPLAAWQDQSGTPCERSEATGAPQIMRSPGVSLGTCSAACSCPSRPATRPQPQSTARLSQSQDEETYRGTTTSHGGRMCVCGAGLASGRSTVDAFAGVVASVEVLEVRQSFPQEARMRHTYAAATVVVADAERRRRRGKLPAHNTTTMPPRH